MAQRSKSFRFRIPWLSVPSESFSRRTKDRPKSPPHSDTSVPIHRPTKPSVIAPAELSPLSPTKTEEVPRAEPKNQSPPHPTRPPSSSASIESPMTTQPNPPSPQPPLQPSSRADSPSRVHIASSPPKTQPQSLSHLASDNGAMKVPKETTPPASSSSEQEKEKMVLAEPKPQETKRKVKSPLTTIAKSPEASFQPERMSTQPADTTEQQVSSVPSSSPVSKTEPTTHPSSPLVSKNIKTEETTPQEEKEKMAVLVPQEEKPKIKSPLKTIPKSPKTSSQPENLYTQPTAIEQGSTTPKATLETQSKSLQPEEKEKVVHETTKARGKGKDKTTTGQPSERTTTSTSGTTTTKAKDSFAKAFRGDKKHHGARETVERKIMFATTNPIGKDTRVLSSTDEGTRNVSSSSISPEETVSSSGEKAPPLQRGIKDDITKFVHKLTASVHPSQPMDDKQFSVITLAGDNRGATMHLGSESAKKEGSIHIHRAYKNDPEETNEVTTDGEENTNEEEDEVGMAYVNSNIQSINNSLMFHGSITERDPGVQVTLPQKPTEPNRPDDKPNPGLENQRTQFNINRAEKSTYQPMVGRSIRGPFLEPNDKPRHHGCKISCDKDIEDIEIL
ncbi:muscle M-line assembly protein unc-89 [Spatholobus suberectus]|nr:muscle M-line assembly protein unc-89 [Spatholobus suberectus]